MSGDRSDVEIAARGMCRAGLGRGHRCPCDGAPGFCMADEMYGREALGAVTALRAAGRIPTPPAGKPCEARDAGGGCIACGAVAGGACAHPALNL